MTPRPHEITKWLLCVATLFAGQIPYHVKGVTVRSPPKTPIAATVQAQSKYFQDFFSVQLSPYNIEFGHVCEDPNTWEQRYEKKDFKNHRDMGKVRWGDKQGGYGEHYWDLNHAGAGDDNNDNDDGYHHDHDHDHDHNHDHDRHDTSDSYEGPPNYSNDDATNYESNNQNDDGVSNYDQSPQYDIDGGRSKRAHSRHKSERKVTRKEEKDEEDEEENKKERDQDRQQTAVSEKPRRAHIHRSHTNHKRSEYNSQTADRNNQQSTTQKPTVDEYEKESQRTASQPEETQSVAYERGAGVRQHQNQLAASSVPRLFLEPSTGHVIDRATGQAYVLQPIIVN